MGGKRDFADYYADMRVWSFGHAEPGLLPDGSVFVAFYAGDAQSLSIRWARLALVRISRSFRAIGRCLRTGETFMPGQTGQVLYRKAKTRIPGGTQLLSKRPEMFLPENWPAYYSRAKGSQVWDLDGNAYYDMSYNGIAACILGAADPDVEEAVIAAVRAGSMSTLNPPEEVELADLLCELHPWAEMVRYARCGGEAMAVAVRIARAHTGRDRVAFCGYHGWHDWYLAANLAEDHALDGHLIPGLAPAGVPRGLMGTALPFRYNHIEELAAIVAKHGNEIGAVVMEPIRNFEPVPGFLEQVRQTVRPDRRRAGGG